MPFTVLDCKIAAASDIYTDQEVEKIFFNVIIEKEEDIYELIASLKRHRPELLKKIESQIKNR